MSSTSATGSRRYDAVIDRSKDLTALVGKLLPRTQDRHVDIPVRCEEALPHTCADSGASTTALPSSESSSGEDCLSAPEPETALPDSPPLRGDTEISGCRRAQPAGPLSGLDARPDLGPRHGCLPCPQAPSRGPGRRARQLRLKQGERHFHWRPLVEVDGEVSAAAIGSAPSAVVRVRAGQVPLRLHELLGEGSGDPEDGEEVPGGRGNLEEVGRGPDLGDSTL